jgi:magnesium-transporting ATPase (P-type)
LNDTLAVSGEGKALVVAVGSRTRAGRAGRILDIDSEATPLQQKLETMADGIGKVGMTVALATFVVMNIRMIIQIAVDPERKFFEVANLSQMLDSFIIGVTVIVVSIPEGLPLAVTVSLAYSVSKMADENNLVRTLAASETMGGANEICTDKTGTLTLNKMTVMALYNEDTVTNGRRHPEFNTLKSSAIMAESILLNCSAYVEMVHGKQICKGNVTEIGMINYLMESGFDVDSVLKLKEQEGILFNIPFNSNRKR